MRGLIAGTGMGIGMGVAYVHADERYLKLQADQVAALAPSQQQR